jgi:hypothetical protein
VLRQFIAGALGASATIGGGVATIQLITGALGAPSAPPVAQSGQNVLIDGVVLGLCVLAYRRDQTSSNKTMARISREEALASLRVELKSGKAVRLSQLRGFVRPVLVAGSASFVRQAADEASEFLPALLERGVLFIPFITEQGQQRLPPSDGEESVRWRADPLYLNEWQSWLSTQLGAASVSAEKGVYVSLRMDGRVRASGVGQPPWRLLASSLPPVDGAFKGFLDGMDGSVNAE